MVRKILLSAIAGISVMGAMAFPGTKPLRIKDGPDLFPGKIERVAPVATRSDEGSNSLDYTHASTVSTAFRLPNMAVGDTVYLAFQIPLTVAKSFAGDEIISINITSGAFPADGRYLNLVREVNLFICGDIDDFKGTTLYEQKGTLGSDGFTEYKIPLDTPFAIDGEESFFVGYYFPIPNLNQYYAAVDAIPTQDLYGCWVGTTDGKGTLKWEELGKDRGNLCLGCTVKGPNLPPVGVSVEDFAGPSYAAPGKTFTYEFLFLGTGPAVTEIEMEYEVGTKDKGTKAVILEEPVNYNKTVIGSLDLECSEIGMGLPVKFRIVKVNGEDFEDADSRVGYVNCFAPELGYNRVHLLEEGTGTWCGYCPGGIVMMEYAGKTYPDFFARAALHASGTTKDPMESSSAMAVVNAYFNYFPSAMVDRNYYLEEMSTEEIDYIVNEFKDIPAVVEFTELTGEMGEKNRCVVTTGIKFPLDFTNSGRYRLAYYVIQNNVGPYDQNNYYSGGSLGPMDGWEREGSSVSTIYNDVARYLGGRVPGYANSIPEEIKGGEVYEHQSSLAVSSVTSDEFQVIAFVVDNLTGEIANAKEISVSKVSGISDIAEDSDIVDMKYYNLNGVEVKTPETGLYIVRKIHADGKTSVSKMMMK